jgi:hypothetical protein
MENITSSPAKRAKIDEDREEDDSMVDVGQDDLGYGSFLPSESSGESGEPRDSGAVSQA